MNLLLSEVKFLLSAESMSNKNGIDSYKKKVLS